MPITMDDLVKGALDAARRSFPRRPRVVDLRHQIGHDWTGDDAVFVWVILDDATPKSRLRRASLQPIEAQIRDAIEETLRREPQLQRDLIPYIHFRLESEQDEIDRSGST